MRMTGTLARYIARRFLMTILGSFLLCSTLIMMIDTVELLRESGKFGAVPAWMIAWMALLRLPAFSELTLPFTVLVGAIGAFLLLSRGSEITIVRASGVSVWQFILPGVVVALLLGILSVVAYNPFAAAARAEGERVFQKAFGRETSLLSRNTDGAQWLRQDSRDGQSVLSSRTASDRGRRLGGVMILQYDPQGHFIERVDAKTALLGEGYWELQDVKVSRFGQEAESYERYVVSTYLTPERVADALGTVGTVSFWQLPGFIELAEKAGLSAQQYRVQYALLLSRPLLLAGMVLLAATVSLRPFRSGGIQTMVITGIVGGIGFFLLAEVSRQVGVSGLTTAHAAAWVPVLVVCLMSMTVLLHQEDG
jgi:lipopolysaccharide export system permease protein